MNEDKGYFEMTIKGKTKRFKSGYDMWKWALQNTKLETKFDSKHGPFLCDWFENRRRK